MSELHEILLHELGELSKQRDAEAKAMQELHAQLTNLLASWAEEVEDEEKSIIGLLRIIRDQNAKIIELLERPPSSDALSKTLERHLKPLLNELASLSSLLRENFEEEDYGEEKEDEEDNYDGFGVADMFKH